MMCSIIRYGKRGAIKMSGYLPTSKRIGGPAVDGCRWSCWRLHLPMLPSIPWGIELIYRKCENTSSYMQSMADRALREARPGLESFMLSFLSAPLALDFNLWWLLVFVPGSVHPGVNPSSPQASPLVPVWLRFQTWSKKEFCIIK